MIESRNPCQKTKSLPIAVYRIAGKRAFIRRFASDDEVRVLWLRTVVHLRSCGPLCCVLAGSDDVTSLTASDLLQAVDDFSCLVFWQKRWFPVLPWRSIAQKLCGECSNEMILKWLRGGWTQVGLFVCTPFTMSWIWAPWIVKAERRSIPDTCLLPADCWRDVIVSWGNETERPANWLWSKPSKVECVFPFCI